MNSYGGSNMGLTQSLPTDRERLDRYVSDQIEQYYDEHTTVIMDAECFEVNN
jgi:hypothetical protein